jgi:hypothetical protein
MDETILVLINSDRLELPKCKALYAIFSASKCRFVGIADDLHQTITGHFHPNERNVPLRYFMQSFKPKILQYELVRSNLSVDEQNSLVEKWIAIYQPTDNHYEEGQLYQEINGSY